MCLSLLVRDVMKKITVCAACLRASCWQGEFYCDDYREASTLQKTKKELKKLGYENAEYWKDK